MHQKICPKVESALQLLSKKWSGFILFALMDGPKRYKDLMGFIPGISDRMLCERFRDLEGAGLIVRRVYPEVPVRIMYELTDKGKALKPILEKLQEWAEQWA
ncbi:MAG: transcriptional regulator [Candidatus Reconcilbacillus cellulovorans]|uniref:Transcriptional regulator n=1 Tax=Candidatus Reconcilbacillus cellulovorans TaxID=1906605 RepID=A0A2A6E104_9BACL|nr:MAG: transcriptional regulator [Candidatus Reconcilbacillus cellulovorans]